MHARATLAVLGTLDNIADALTSADVETGDLYAVADALQAARNAVLAAALERVALDEGHALAARHRRTLRRGGPQA